MFGSFRCESFFLICGSKIDILAFLFLRRSSAINAGEDLAVNNPDAEGRKNKVNQNAIFINAENGDVTIRARNGKLRLEGLDIEMVATGNNPEGTLWVHANENIKLDSKNITVDGSLSVSLVSTGVVNVRSSLTLMASGLVAGVTAASLKSIIPKNIQSIPLP